MGEDLTFLDSVGWEAVKKALNLRVVIVSEKLMPSSRNRVWVVETDVRPVVVKMSLSKKGPDEFEFLVRARGAGLDVPFPLFMHEDYIVMEYVSGEPCDFLVNHFFSTDACVGIGEWLAAYHEKLGDSESPTVMGDCVLSNFVMHEGRVFGFDLESSYPGEPLDDLGQMAASILGSEPFFTPVKFDLCMDMFRAYERRTSMETVESVRPYVARHLEKSAFARPLFRRTFYDAAKSLRRGWPKLA